VKPIVKRGKQQKIVKEVIGEDGLKVAEYVDEGKDKIDQPYTLLEETVMAFDD